MQELRGAKIPLDGAICPLFKIGEDASCHLRIHRQRETFIGSQLSICVLEGKYYLRDISKHLEILIKLDSKISIGLREDCIINLSKSVNY